MSGEKPEQKSAQNKASVITSAVDSKKPSIAFEEIADGAQEVLILYKDQVYRLRETKNGKLILNK